MGEPYEMSAVLFRVEDLGVSSRAHVPDPHGVVCCRRDAVFAAVVKVDGGERVALVGGEEAWCCEDLGRLQ